MTELRRLGEVSGVTNGSNWVDGTVKDSSGLRGENGGSDTGGKGEVNEGLLGGRGGSCRVLGVGALGCAITGTGSLG